MKTTVKAALIALFGVWGMLHSAQALALDCVDATGIIFERDGGCYTPHGGGGEVPVPFGLKATAELADGENYILIGRIYTSGKKPGPYGARVYFEVDLKEQPWLANAKRKAMPYYPLEGASAQWKQWDGQRVKLSVRAHGRIVRIDNELQYVISLEGCQPE